MRLQLRMYCEHFRYFDRKKFLVKSFHYLTEYKTYRAILTKNTVIFTLTIFYIM
jgi:hypothetical protein